jgi:hypothetical protein
MCPLDEGCPDNGDELIVCAMDRPRVKGERRPDPCDRDALRIDLVQPVIARDFVLLPGHQLGIAIGSQVDMNPKGLGGNGFAPIPSGGVTELELGPETVVELDLLPGKTPLIATP